MLNASLTVPGTPVKVISIALERLDFSASSSTAASANLRNLIETSESHVASLERELNNCATYVHELAATKSALEDMLIAAETRLKDANDVRTLKGARLRAIET